MKYIALLRGINVSGQKKIKMEDLRKLCEAIGFQHVQTYIQSGNIIFESPESEAPHLAYQLSEAIREKYDFEVTVIVRTPAELEDVLAKSPYSDSPTDKTYYVLLEAEPSSEKWAKLDANAYLPDTFAYVGKVIYLHVVSYGNTKLSNNFFEAKLKLSATTRNHNTIQKLIEMCR